jgi:TolB-like protein/DNA-binding winged helix-turn-helix (wHTH) protein/Flp pilus assembly protein TadD
VPGDAAQSDRTVSFDSFVLDLRTAELTSQGKRIRLAAQPAQVLRILVVRAGNLVTREELRSALWPSETFVDFDHGLNNCINRIREVLRDSATQPRFIETLPKLGYRFVAPVCEEQRESLAEAGPEPPVLPAAPLEKQTLHRSWLYAGISVAAIAVLVTVYLLAKRQGAVQATTRPAVRAIAVLPLTNLSGDSSQDFVTDGVTDDLITDIAKVSPIPVVSRTSVLRYKQRQNALPEIARELGVDAVVEGTLRRTGSNVQITLNLIDAPNDAHLWVNRYEGSLNNISDLEARAASDLAASMRPVRSSPTQKPKSLASISPDAWEEYQLGQSLWKQFQIEPALHHYERAVALQSNYAAAYAGIAKSYCRLEYIGVMSAAEAFPPASAAVDKALALDPDNADAHAAKSFLLAQRDWNWEGAELEDRTAVALDPSNALPHRWYSYILRLKGRNQEALDEAREAARLDPAAVGFVSNYAGCLDSMGRVKEAITRFQTAVELQPDNPDLHLALGTVCLKDNRFDMAEKELERSYELSNEPSIARQLHRAWATGKYQTAADEAVRSHTLNQLHELQKRTAAHKYVSASEWISCYAKLNNREKTLAWLGEGYRSDAHVMIELRNPMFDFIRDDPRFQEIYQKVPFAH